MAHSLPTSQPPSYTQVLEDDKLRAEAALDVDANLQLRAEAALDVEANFLLDCLASHDITNSGLIEAIANRTVQISSARHPHMVYTTREVTKDNCPVLVKWMLQTFEQFGDTDIALIAFSTECFSEFVRAFEDHEKSYARKENTLFYFFKKYGATKKSIDYMKKILELNSLAYLSNHIKDLPHNVEQFEPSEAKFSYTMLSLAHSVNILTFGEYMEIMLCGDLAEHTEREAMKIQFGYGKITVCTALNTCIKSKVIQIGKGAFKNQYGYKNDLQLMINAGRADCVDKMNTFNEKIDEIIKKERNHQEHIKNMQDISMALNNTLEAMELSADPTKTKPEKEKPGISDSAQEKSEKEKPRISDSAQGSSDKEKSGL